MEEEDAGEEGEGKEERKEFKESHDGIFVPMKPIDSKRSKPIALFITVNAETTYRQLARKTCIR